MITFKLRVEPRITVTAPEELVKTVDGGYGILFWNENESLQTIVMLEREWIKGYPTSETVKAEWEMRTGLIQLSVEISPYEMPVILLDEDTKRIFADKIIKALKQEYSKINGGQED